MPRIKPFEEGMPMGYGAYGDHVISFNANNTSLAVSDSVRVSSASMLGEGSFFIQGKPWECSLTDLTGDVVFVVNPRHFVVYYATLLEDKVTIVGKRVRMNLISGNFSVIEESEVTFTSGEKWFKFTSVYAVSEHHVLIVGHSDNLQWRVSVIDFSTNSIINQQNHHIRPVVNGSFFISTMNGKRYISKLCTSEIDVYIESTLLEGMHTSNWHHYPFCNVPWMLMVDIKNDAYIYDGTNLISFSIENCSKITNQKINSVVLLRKEPDLIEFGIFIKYVFLHIVNGQCSSYNIRFPYDSLVCRVISHIMLDENEYFEADMTQFFGLKSNSIEQVSFCDVSESLFTIYDLRKCGFAEFGIVYPSGQKVLLFDVVWKRILCLAPPKDDTGAFMYPLQGEKMFGCYSRGKTYQIQFTEDYRDFSAIELFDGPPFCQGDMLYSPDLRVYHGSTPIHNLADGVTHVPFRISTSINNPKEKVCFIMEKGKLTAIKTVQNHGLMGPTDVIDRLEVTDIQQNVLSAYCHSKYDDVNFYAFRKSQREKVWLLKAFVWGVGVFSVEVPGMIRAFVKEDLFIVEDNQSSYVCLADYNYETQIVSFSKLYGDNVFSARKHNVSPGCIASCSYSVDDKLFEIERLNYTRTEISIEKEIVELLQFMKTAEMLMVDIDPGLL
ncbi:hypothetical protein PCE1_001461 [Barthelona sp. PCE]